MPDLRSHSSDNGDEQVQNYHPGFASSIPIAGGSSIRSRRSSVLDYGGENSFNNFSSSVKRSVNFLSASTGSGHRHSLPDSFAIHDSPEYSSAVPGISAPSPNILSSQTFSFPVSTSYLDENYHPIRRKSLPSEVTPLIPEQIRQSIKDDERQVLFGQGEIEDVIITSRSTPVQTIFNSINVLIGLGILSIPLAIHLSGWILGIICLTLAALTTKYTAILLGRILSKEPLLKTYQDIARHAFGASIGYFVFCVFATDLYGASVSMVILFSDSFSAIFEDVAPIFFKTFVCTLLLVLNFLPLRILSFLSLIGILCTSTTFLIIVISGLTKVSAPGSLLNPMPSNLFPSSFIDFCFSLGLYLAPWGGHAAFPEVYSDQGKPNTYDSCMSIAFGFSYTVDLATGVLGFLMFGAIVDDEVTRSILTTEGYPGWISTVIVVLMGLLPLSKLPLVCRPIVTAFDSFNDATGSLTKQSFNRIMISATLFISSILITSFGKIMSLLGSSICFTVCITLPLAFYLKIFADELTLLHKISIYSMMAVSVVLTLLGSAAVVVA